MAKNVSKVPSWMGDVVPSTPSNEHKHVHEHEHEPVFEPEIKVQVTPRERKTSHIHWLTYPSLTKEMEEYCRRHDFTRAELLEYAVVEFMKQG